MKSNEPLVSLIIPMYNSEKYIKNCVACIKRQNYKNLEVFLINDGSTDNTVELCQKYIKDMNNVRLITIKKQGVSVARNVGLNNANGDYIAFADADDFFFEDYIEYLVHLALKYDADIAVCNYRKQKADGLKLKNPPKKIYEKVYSITEALENVSYRKELSGSPCAKLIRKQTAEQIRFNEQMAYSEDYLYVCNAINVSNRIVFSNSIKYLYLQHGESATHKSQRLKRIQSWQALIENLDIYINMYPEISNCFYSKGIAVSINLLRGFSCNIETEKTDIKKYIKKNSLRVAKDKNNTLKRRIMALMVYVNTDYTIFLFAKGLRMLEKIHIYI